MLQDKNWKKKIYSMNNKMPNRRPQEKKDIKYLKLDEVGSYMAEKFGTRTRVTDAQVNFAIMIAEGASYIEAYRAYYSVAGLSKPNIRNRARSLLMRPETQDLIKIAREQISNRLVFDINTILLRFESLYQDAVDDDDNLMQLQVLKEMGKLIINMKGEVTINNTVVEFKLPNKISFDKQIELKDGSVKTISNISSQVEINRIIKEQIESEDE